MNGNIKNNSENKPQSHILSGGATRETRIPGSPFLVDAEMSSSHRVVEPHGAMSALNSPQSPTFWKPLRSISQALPSTLLGTIPARDSSRQTEGIRTYANNVSGPHRVLSLQKFEEYGPSGNIDTIQPFCQPELLISSLPLPNVSQILSPHDYGQSARPLEGLAGGVLCDYAKCDDMQYCLPTSANLALKRSSELLPSPSAVELPPFGPSPARTKRRCAGVLHKYGIGTIGHVGYELPPLKACDIELSRFAIHKNSNIQQQRSTESDHVTETKDDNPTLRSRGIADIGQCKNNNLSSKLSLVCAAPAPLPTRLPTSSKKCNVIDLSTYQESNTSNVIDRRSSVDWSSSNCGEPRLPLSHTTPNLNDWETIIEMYFTGVGTNDGRPLRSSIRNCTEKNYDRKESEVTGGRYEMKEDRKILEKHRTIGRTYEALGKVRFERHIGYCIDRNSGVRKKQRMYHVVNRCRIVRGLLKDKHELPSDSNEFERLLCQLEMEKRERSRARKEAADDEGPHEDAADDRLEDASIP